MKRHLGARKLPIGLIARRRVALLALGTLVLASCSSGDSSDVRSDATTTSEAGSEPSTDVDPTSPSAESTPPVEAVPWETISRFLDIRRGQYTKLVTVEGPGESTELENETVLFDLDVPFIDRRSVVQGENGEVGELRFIYTDEAMLMWNAGVEEQCGTPWIDLAGSSQELAPGMEPQDYLIVEPLETLRMATESPLQSEILEAATVYELPLAAGTGFSISSAMRQDPALWEQILELEHVAEVSVPRTEDTLAISVDMGDVLETASGEVFPEGYTAITTWTVTAGAGRIDTTLPTNVAESSCMNS